MLNLSKHYEDHIIQYGLVAFWLLFWLFNFIDKIIGGSTFLWVGKDRLQQFVDYFATIGIHSPLISHIALIIVAILQLIAFIYLLIALIKLIQKKKIEARGAFFWGTLYGLIIFSLFAIGDQVFGDRRELWEHTTFWMALVVSWGAYNHFTD